MILSTSTDVYPISNARMYSNSSKEFILGGYPCMWSEKPYLVSIRYASSMRHFCGGSILTELWILTAAHCLTLSDTSQYMVVAGYNRKSNLGFQQGRSVYNYIVHEQYNRKLVINDIALIKLRRPLKLGPTVQKVVLGNWTGEVYELCKTVEIFGWGKRQEDRPKARFRPENRVLNCAIVNIVPSDRCAAFLELFGYRLHKQVCIYDYNKTVCKGDSGTPLICQGQQYGVTSYQFGCVKGPWESKGPAVFCNPIHYHHWIADAVSGRIPWSGAENHLHHISLVILTCILLLIT